MRFVTSVLVMAAAVSGAARGERRNDIEFAKPGGYSLTLDAWVPQGKGPFAAAIIVHGGGWVNGTKLSYVPPLFEPLTNGGFAWFTINYRLAPAYKFPAPIEDVESAIRYVKAHAKEFKVDPARLALIGESAGGHLVSYVGAHSKEKVKAVVSFYGPHDLERRAKAMGQVGENLEKLFGLKELDGHALKVMRDASPVNYVHKGMPPYLLIHGTKDAAVPYDQSPLMCEKMKAVGVSCELFTVEDAPHGIGPWEKNPEFQKYKPVMIEWLKKTL